MRCGELGLANLVAVGIAKKEELIYTRDREEPIVLPKDDPALRLVQQIRDEAHRFAVTFHRKARTMRDLRSELDSVPGHRTATPESAARGVRQPGGRAPRIARRPDGASSARKPRTRCSDTSPKRAADRLYFPPVARRSTFLPSSLRSSS